MKQKHIFLILLLASVVFLQTLIGCASTKTSGSAEDQGLYYENPQTEEKLLIEDWKYMGFGHEIPEWIIPALENNVQEIKVVLPELANSEILILQAAGYNQDQAASGLKEKQQVKSAGYKLFDSSWVKVTDKVNNIEKLYISVAVYYK